MYLEESAYRADLVKRKQCLAELSGDRRKELSAALRDIESSRSIHMPYEEG